MVFHFRIQSPLQRRVRVRFQGRQSRLIVGMGDQRKTLPITITTQVSGLHTLFNISVGLTPTNISKNSHILRLNELFLDFWLIVGAFGAIGNNFEL